MTEQVKKVVLAYSAELDTSVILRWLIETYGCEVVAFSADIGQEDELDTIEEKALKTGASKVYIDDLKESFIRDYVFPAFRANVLYEGQYLLGTSIARPLIAKRQIEIANIEGADAVSHGATGKGNDQVRFELSYYALKPDIKIVAPWRIWDLTSRTALMAFAERFGIPVLSTRKKPYSTDRNMLHISYEGGILEDPWQPPPEDIFTLTVSPREGARHGRGDRDHLCQRRPDGHQRQKHVSGNPLQGTEPAGREARGRPGRHRGEPVRGDEIEGRL